jgi:hypothetical protein
VQEREITLGDLGRLQEWVKSEPFAPDGDWYKDFGLFKLCGSNEYGKTGLTKSMAALGKRIQERGKQ